MDIAIVLTYMSGPEDGSVVNLRSHIPISELIFGRLASCDVALPHDPLVSRRHARLFLQDDAWWLEDFGSSNGTFVGEFSQAVKVTAPVRLFAGQVFQVGRTRFQLGFPVQQATANAAEQAISE